MPALHFLIADDHPLFRAAMCALLLDMLPEARVVQTDSFDALVAALAVHRGVDLVLLDLSMPGALGLSVLVYLRNERPATPVLVVSANDAPATIRLTRQFGAAGFLPKSSEPARMLATVRAVLAGDEVFPESTMLPNEADARLASRLAQLTPQQLRVLMALANGLLNKQIAHQLGVSENTVKVHVSAILRKLECVSRTQLAVLVKGLEAGIRYPPGAASSGRSAQP